MNPHRDRMVLQAAALELLRLSRESLTHRHLSTANNPPNERNRYTAKRLRREHSPIRRLRRLSRQRLLREGFSSTFLSPSRPRDIMRVEQFFTTAAALGVFATGAHAQNRTIVDVIDAGPVGVWMNHLEYRPFEQAEVAFSGPAGSHVLVLRIGDDGYNVRGFTTVEILYP